MQLPMEIWAHVASFLPFSELVPTFQSLYTAGVLPDTDTTSSNALLQFCSEHGYHEEESDLITVPNKLWTTLLQMGFEGNLIEYAMILCHGNEPQVVDFLLNHHP